MHAPLLFVALVFHPVQCFWLLGQESRLVKNETGNYNSQATCSSFIFNLSCGILSASLIWLNPHSDSTHLPPRIRPDLQLGHVPQCNVRKLRPALYRREPHKGKPCRPRCELPPATQREQERAQMPDPLQDVSAGAVHGAARKLIRPCSCGSRSWWVMGAGDGHPISVSMKST